MLKFYFNGSPNPTKIALFLEEAGLPYEPIPVDTRRGQQFSPDYLAINPNGKVPAIVDDGAIVFDSNAILLYLAEKTGKFMSAPTLAAKGEMLSWHMFVALALGHIPGKRCISSISRLKKSIMPRNATSMRRSAITAFSTRG